MSVPRVGYLIGRSRLTGYAGLATSGIWESVGRNTGNLAFLSAIPTHLAQPVEHVGWSVAPERLREFDLLVFPAANQFGAHTDLGDLADRLLAAGVPVLAIGLGAQAAPGERVRPSAGTLRWARALQDLRAGEAPNILVRGRFTQEALAEYGVTSTAVAGCPSLFLDLRPGLGQAVAARRDAWWPRPRRVATVAGNSCWGWSAPLDRLLLDLARRGPQGLALVLQEEPDLMALARREPVEPAAVERLRRHYAPAETTAAFVDLVVSQAAVFADVDAWMEHLRRFDAVAGPRFHGVMLGIQAGVPGVVVTHDSRTAELATTTGLPQVARERVEAGGEGALWAAIAEFDADAFDAGRRALAAAYVGALKAHGLAVSPLLGRLRD